MYYTDKELLDFLQSLTDRKEYTGKVICRHSIGVYGWQLHETAHSGAVPDVRQAIKDFMDEENYLPPDHKRCIDQEAVERERILQEDVKLRQEIARLRKLIEEQNNKIDKLSNIIGDRK